ncbi:MAG: hypothetical protein FWD76_01200 [Firmicutes bacterium]|nr:hypothetical protein [Bacillota bacterium]
MICNNQHCKKIYLYYLPRGSVTRDDFKIRLDKDCFHIEIDCNDENVACQMSGFGFKNYFVGEMLYSEIEA